jgi:hypothetical protein
MQDARLLNASTSSKILNKCKLVVVLICGKTLFRYSSEDDYRASITGAFQRSVARCAIILNALLGILNPLGCGFAKDIKPFVCDSCGHLAFACLRMHKESEP